MLNEDFKKVLNTVNTKFDLIFIDPPYKSNFVEESLNLIYEKSILNDDGLIIIETDETQKIQELLNSKSYINILKTKNYGRVSLFIISF